MSLNAPRVRQLLATGELRRLFIEELGWDQYSGTLEVRVGAGSVALHALAQKRGMVAYLCPTALGEQLPDHARRRRIEEQVAKAAHEHLIVFADASNETQVWQWVKREAGKPAACREHTYRRTQPGDALLQKLEAIAFTLEEEERLSLPDVTRRTRVGFDVERVTKRFYDRFQKEHAAFLAFITGIAQQGDREWYASVMLNRLMFVYFIQRKGFLDGDRDYLRNRLNRLRAERGQDRFYSFYRYFLLRLFHEGLGRAVRSAELEQLVGRIPYLNGGLFDVHELEKPDRYGVSIQIPDEAFARIFDYFDQYQWHLDERPLRADNEINPDVLGYIFEKYINQKQMGAYYTKEDITVFIGRSTVLPVLLEATAEKCRVAFENPNGPTVWDLLQRNPDRYIHESVRYGVGTPLPADIAAGIDPPTRDAPVRGRATPTLVARSLWNRLAPPTHALPGETWRDVVARREHYTDVHAQLAAGSIRAITDLVTLNLDIRQFAQDIIETSEGPELLRACWNAIGHVSILDPTCGSGAFLFAALNILEPLYEACLERMEAFVEDAHGATTAKRERNADFSAVLAQVIEHPNRRYFTLKSIILNNLFGVDIMEEAVEICKLRLFLKLAAQVEPDPARANLGIEPLPDIDFNVRAGNTLVGYATYAEVERAVTSKFDFDKALTRISTKAADLQAAFDAFRERQVRGESASASAEKQSLQQQLRALDDELDRYLAAEYGIDSTDGSAYSRWLESHRPFHWFVDFYGILNRGGFDVVIGNPPYVEYAKVKGEYMVPPSYRTLPSGNLYTLVLERCYVLAREAGWVSLIVPLSLAATARTATVRQLVARFRSWVSAYDMRPSSLFESVAQRLCILVSQNSSGPMSALFTAGYRRWSAEERPTLLDRTRYTCATDLKPGAVISKFMLPIEHRILAKVAGPSLEQFTSKAVTTPTLVHRIVRYFVKALNFVPLFVDASGVRGKSADYKEFRFLADDRDQITALLNSTLFYWFWRSHGDGFHCGYTDVYSMPYRRVVDGAVRRSLKRLLATLMERLRRTSERRTITTKTGQITYEEFYPAEAKPILDRIDHQLARHYGFTEDELDYLLNYDTKYRLRANDGGSDDEEQGGA